MNSTQNDIESLKAEVQKLKKQSAARPETKKGYSNNFYKVSTIILLVVLIASGAYAYYFYAKTRDQVVDLNTKYSKLSAVRDQASEENKRVSSRADALQKQVGELQSANNELAAKLKVKPTTVTVYQSPAPSPSTYFPKTTTCNPNVFGGFTCY